MQAINYYMSLPYRLEILSDPDEGAQAFRAYAGASDTEVWIV